MSRSDNEMASTFTPQQKQRLLALKGVTGVGGTELRRIYVVEDTPEIRAQIEEAVGSKRYRIELVEPFQAQKVL